MRLPALLALLALAFPAAAAGPAEGVSTARAEAELRADAPVLVEIEGFAGPDGQIPCSRSSYSNSWHYKFYAAGEWLIVNACGPSFINYAKHTPYDTSGEPRTRLPRSFASPAEVLKKLAEDKIFVPVPNQFDRDVLMTLHNLPAADGRPEGCYWSVSQGKTRVLADCAAEKTWALSGKGSAGGTGTAAGPLKKGRDTAGRYARAAIDTIRRKYPGAQLMFIESLADRTGSAKCVTPNDGWSYVFLHGGSRSAFGACLGKTAAEYVLFDGSAGGGLEKVNPISLPFKDSDFALSQVPKDCVKNYATISMKLQNFKAPYAQFAGHSLVWTIDCGSLRYLVDANTGSYLGPGDKTAGRGATKHEKIDLGLGKP